MPAFPQMTTYCRIEHRVQLAGRAASRPTSRMRRSRTGERVGRRARGDSGSSAEALERRGVPQLGARPAVRRSAATPAHAPTAAWRPLLLPPLADVVGKEIAPLRHPGGRDHHSPARTTPSAVRSSRAATRRAAAVARLHPAPLGRLREPAAQLAIHSRSSSALSRAEPPPSSRSYRRTRCCSCRRDGIQASTPDGMCRYGRDRRLLVRAPRGRWRAPLRGGVTADAAAEPSRQAPATEQRAAGSCRYASTHASLAELLGRKRRAQPGVDGGGRPPAVGRSGTNRDAALVLIDGASTATAVVVAAETAAPTAEGRAQLGDKLNGSRVGRRSRRRRAGA